MYWIVFDGFLGDGKRLDGKELVYFGVEEVGELGFEYVNGVGIDVDVVELKEIVVWCVGIGGCGVSIVEI